MFSIGRLRRASICVCDYDLLISFYLEKDEIFLLNFFTKFFAQLASNLYILWYEEMMLWKMYYTLYTKQTGNICTVNCNSLIETRVMFFTWHHSMRTKMRIFKPRLLWAAKFKLATIGVHEMWTHLIMTSILTPDYSQSWLAQSLWEWRYQKASHLEPYLKIVNMKNSNIQYMINNVKVLKTMN